MSVNRCSGISEQPLHTQSYYFISHVVLVLFCLDPGPPSPSSRHYQKQKALPSPVLKMDALSLQFNTMMQLLVMWATADSISRVFLSVCNVLLAAGGIIHGNHQR